MNSDSLPQFRGGFGRGRGRGRGRGGFYEDHRPQGRSRSPEPIWNRRTQPSATPPPQVPAFGSTSAGSLVASKPPISPAAMMSDSSKGPLPGVAVPTAPSRMSRARHSGISSVQWINPALKAGKQSLDTPTAPSRPASNIPSATRQSTSELDANVSPGSQPQRVKDAPPNEAQGSTEQATGASESRIEPETPTIHRSPDVGRRATKDPGSHSVVSEIGDESVSDSGNEFNDEFFEEEISNAKDGISKLLKEDSLQAMTEKPTRAPFILLFITSATVDAVEALEAAFPKICISTEAQVVQEELVAESNPAITTLVPESKAEKAKSQSPEPQLEAMAVEVAQVNGTGHSQHVVDTSSKAPLESSEQQQDSVPIETPDLASVHYDSPDADHEDDDIEPSVDQNNQHPPAANGRIRNGSVMMDTFEESDDEQTKFENMEEMEIVRKFMVTPPISSLPSFNNKPWNEDEAFLKTLAPNPPIVELIRQNLQDTERRRSREKQEERHRWRNRYYEYRQFTDFSNDDAAVRSRNKFLKSQAEAAAAAAAPSMSSISATAKPEGGRRMGRFATEHDIERVLRESEQEAREKKEVEDRATRAKTASAKEASIPDMAWDEEEWNAKKFVDRTHLIPFERSFARLEFSEPIDNFTPDECAEFERVYMEFPKQWGKIAGALPNRDYKACIQHYYLVKHESNLKEKLKKQPKKRKGRKAKGNPKSSALMADLGLTIRDEHEDAADAENGERRRPRRAAAPVWPFEPPASESEVASPAPTPGRKSAAASKNDSTTDTPAPKQRRKKEPREKVVKQAKNSQLLAAAPVPANRQASPAIPSASTEWKQRREPIAPAPGPSPIPAMGAAPVPGNFTPQYDVSGPIQSGFAPAFISSERPSPSMNVNFEVMSQSFPTQERLGSATPMNFDAQQDRRNPQQTSSYWSVPEQNDFAPLLRHFGTDWHGIAKWMTSKTHIMVYTTVFQQWLAVPSDSNKSRRVANIQTQVKNYYQRQVDSGKREWEDMARDADEKRARGDPVGPLPTPTVIPKRRYDLTPGTAGRPGSAMDGSEEMSPLGSNAIASQVASPQPVSMTNTRFSTLAQAIPISQPATPASILHNHLPPQPIQQPLQQSIQQAMQQPMQQPMQQSMPQSIQPTIQPTLQKSSHSTPQPGQQAIQQAPPQIQQQQQPQQSRQGRGSGPSLGYFPTEPSSSRPTLQADAVSQRSLMVAQEAQIERQNAIRIEREQNLQREQQQALERQRQEAAMREQQLAMQREQSMQREQVQREQQQQQALALQKEQREREQQQLQIQQQQQALQQQRHFQMKQENDPPNLRQYEPYGSPSVRAGSSSQPRPEPARLGLPPAQEARRLVQPQPYQPRNPVRNLINDNGGPLHREIKSSPSPAMTRPPPPPPPTNVESYAAPPAQPGPVAALRQPEVRKTSSIMSLLNNDEPSDNRPTPTKRVSDVSASSLQPSRTPPPPQLSRYSNAQPSPHIPQQIQQQQVPPPQQSISQQPVSQSPHPYAQPSPHPMHQHSSSLGRSYTPTFEGRGYTPSQMQQQQQMYGHQPRQSMPPQPQAPRREPSLSDVHGLAGGYGRPPGPPQSRLKESPYSVATPPPQAQQPTRLSAGSPLEMPSMSERDYYQQRGQAQYSMQPQTSAAGSPHLGPSYNPQSQPPPQPSHRQLVFGQSPSHVASPPAQHVSQQHQLQRSRHNSSDGRSQQQIPSTSAPAPPPIQGYNQAPQYQNPGHPMYPQQQPHPSQDPRFRDNDYERRQQDEIYYRQRIDEQRRMEDQKRRMDERR